MSALPPPASVLPISTKVFNVRTTPRAFGVYVSYAVASIRIGPLAISGVNLAIRRADGAFVALMPNDGANDQKFWLECRQTQRAVAQHLLATYKTFTGHEPRLSDADGVRSA